MANPERGEARLDVDGTGYKLKLTMTAAVQLQRSKGKPLGLLFNAVQDLDVDAIAGIVWACLQEHHPRQFKDETAVLQLMEKAGGLGGLNIFVEAITELLQANKSNGNGASGESDPPAAGGTVASSTSAPEASA